MPSLGIQVLVVSFVGISPWIFCETLPTSFRCSQSSLLQDLVQLIWGQRGISLSSGSLAYPLYRLQLLVSPGISPKILPAKARMFVIAGNIGVSPASGASLTGFSFTKDSSNTFATSTQVTGKLFAADFTSPTPSQLPTAVLDMQAAFNDGQGRMFPDSLNLLSGMLFQSFFQCELY